MMLKLHQKKSLTIRNTKYCTPEKPSQQKTSSPLSCFFLTLKNTSSMCFFGSTPPNQVTNPTQPGNQPVCQKWTIHPRFHTTQTSRLFFLVDGAVFSETKNDTFPFNPSPKERFEGLGKTFHKSRVFLEILKDILLEFFKT